jgi:transcriptional regulator with XRE-family HTH domain
MDRVAKQIAVARRRLGLTQRELARSSRVSLATIQNIEEKRGNPAASTLEKIAGALGLEVALCPLPVSWDKLARLGIPLSLPVKLRSRRPQPDELVSALKLAASHLSEMPGMAREREAVQAALLALRRQFPAFYRRHLERSQAIGSVFPVAITGRLVKLARLATSRFAEYL